MSEPESEPSPGSWPASVTGPGIQGASRVPQCGPAQARPGLLRQINRKPGPAQTGSRTAAAAAEDDAPTLGNIDTCHQLSHKQLLADTNQIHSPINRGDDEEG